MSGVFTDYFYLRLKPHTMHREHGILHDFHEGPLPFDRFRRQEMPVLYARNGPAVLGTRAQVLQSRRSFYGETVVPYLMDSEDSIDIDALQDLVEAERLLKARK